LRPSARARVGASRPGLIDSTNRTDDRTIGRTVSEKQRRGKLFRETVAAYASSATAGASTKLSISLPTDLVEVVRAAAAQSGLSVSATIAAALRRTLGDAEQARLDAALELDREENIAWARAYAPMAAELIGKLEW
jgi:hypothetical protein